ncbi:hypothetical protein P8452_27633 [Trifolium repens]|nr:hypothetical protein P8452_27633 [Trifolium repens]
MVYANWFIEKNFAKLEADALKKKLDLSLKAIFEEYNNSVGGGVGGSQGESEPTKSNRQIGNPSYYYGQFMQSTLQSTGVANSSGFKSELIKYFNDGLEEDSPNFDILNYWKIGLVDHLPHCLPKRIWKILRKLSEMCFRKTYLMELILVSILMKIEDVLPSWTSITCYLWRSCLFFCC